VAESIELTEPLAGIETPSRVEAVFRSLGQRVAIVAVASLLLIACGTVVDIILRNFFGTALYGLNEISALLVAIAAATCLPYGLGVGAALNVDLVSHLLSDSGKRWLVYFGALLGAIFFGVLGYRVWMAAEQMAVSNQTTLMTGLAVSPFFRVMAVAIGLGAVSLVFEAARTALRLFEEHPYAPLISALIILALVHPTLALFNIVDPAIYRAVIPANPIVLATVVVIVMWALIMLMVPIGVAMGLSGIVGIAALFGMSSALSVTGSETTGFITRDALSVLPLFLLMGAFAGVAGVGSDLYRLSNALVGHIRKNGFELPARVFENKHGDTLVTRDELLGDGLLGRGGLPGARALRLRLGRGSDLVGRGGRLGAGRRRLARRRGRDRVGPRFRRREDLLHPLAEGRLGRQSHRRGCQRRHARAGTQVSV